MSRLNRFLEFFGCKPTYPMGFNGISSTSTCERCGRRILCDSTGGWFPAGDFL